MGTSHSSPNITSADLQRWRYDGRPVLVDRQRRRRSPGGRMHERRHIRLVHDGPEGRLERDHHYSRHPGRWWVGESSRRGRCRDASSPPFLSASSTWGHADADGFFFVPGSRAQPGAGTGSIYPNPAFGGTETEFHACRPGVFDCAPRFGRGPVIVEESWLPPPHRFACGPRGRSMPPPSFGAPWDDILRPPSYPRPYPPRGDRMAPPFGGDYGGGGPYMSGGLGRQDATAGAFRGAEAVPERGRIGFRPELLLEEGRADD